LCLRRRPEEEERRPRELLRLEVAEKGALPGETHRAKARR